MRLGRAEKAGSGVDKIVSGWQSLGWPVPTVAGGGRAGPCTSRFSGYQPFLCRAHLRL